LIVGGPTDARRTARERLRLQAPGLFERGRKDREVADASRVSEWTHRVATAAVAGGMVTARVAGMVPVIARVLPTRITFCTLYTSRHGMLSSRAFYDVPACPS
jgi:hypothetical protein